MNAKYIKSIRETAHPDVRVVEYAKLNNDVRGSFSVIYEKSFIADIEQINIAYNSPTSMRGLHMQDYKKNPQARIMMAAHGALFIVAVDMRFDSPYFGKHVSLESSHINRLALFAPGGFAWGLASYTDASVLYFMDKPYIEECSLRIKYNDPILGIDWPKLQFYVSNEDENEAISFTEYKEKYG